jgi:hypothetical protein
VSQGNHCGFRGTVCRFPGIAILRRGRRNIDDAAKTLTGHQFRNRLSEIKQGEKIDFELIAQCLHGGHLEQGVKSDPGVVNQSVYRSFLAHQALNRGFYRIGIRQIETERPDFNLKARRNLCKSCSNSGVCWRACA